MDFRFGLALVLTLLAPACTAVVAPDTTRLGGRDGGGRDGTISELDTALPDGAVPDEDANVDPPDGAPRFNGRLVAHPMTIHDARHAGAGS